MALVLMFFKSISYPRFGLTRIDDVFERFGDCHLEIYFLDMGGKKEEYNFYMPKFDCEQLAVLKLITKNGNYGKLQDFWFDPTLAFINQKWFLSSEKTSYGFSKEKYLAFLVEELEKFSALFNLYLDLIVSKLCPNAIFTIKSKVWTLPKKIFSFNYTNTYQRLYNSVDVDYLHGSHGKFQNIVLGISELEDEYLKKLKAYGFTKYHQKLLKNTNYLFLEQYKANMY